MEPGELRPLDLSSLRAAVLSLRAAIDVVSSASFATAAPAWQDTLRAGVVQNFDFTFELSWKMLKRQLERTLPSPAELDTASYRELIRIGHRVGLLSDVEAWFEFREWRNVTAHTYAKEKALQVVNAAPRLLEHATALLHAIERPTHG